MCLLSRLTACPSNAALATYFILKGILFLTQQTQLLLCCKKALFVSALYHSFNICGTRVLPRLFDGTCTSKYSTSSFSREREACNGKSCLTGSTSGKALTNLTHNLICSSIPSQLTVTAHFPTSFPSPPRRSLHNDSERRRRRQ